jgi:hypothetical protein
MKRTPPKHSMRQKMWQTIRIKRRFTIDDLLITVPAAKGDNARKLLILLEKGGFIAPIPGYVGGRPGTRKAYRLVKDVGPICPVKSQSPAARQAEKEGEAS